MIGRASRLSMSSMYRRSGGTSERYGDSMMSRGTLPFQRSQRSRNSLALSSLVATCTAFTAGEIDRANAIARAAARSRRPTGTMTMGGFGSATSSSSRSMTRASCICR